MTLGEWQVRSNWSICWGRVPQNHATKHAHKLRTTWHWVARLWVAVTHCITVGHRAPIVSLQARLRTRGVCTPTSLESHDCARSYCSLQQLCFKIWLKWAWRTWIWWIMQNLPDPGILHLQENCCRQAGCAETCGVMWQRRNENINDFHSLLFTKSAHNLC